MGTRGKVKALTALGAAKSENKARILEGKVPQLGGKPVSPGKFAKSTGQTVGSIKKSATKAAGGDVAKAKKDAEAQASASKAGASKAARMVKGKPGAKVKPGAFRSPAQK